MPGAPVRCTHDHDGLACAKALLSRGWQTWQEHQSDTMQARPALARASKGIAGLDLNMPRKHAGSTDAMHTRPPRARMCKGIAELWLTNMAGAPTGYDPSTARTGSRKQRHCRAWPKHARSTDTMHARPPRARMCKGIAETWLTNMAGAPIGYDTSAARTGWRMQRHCSAGF